MSEIDLSQLAVERDEKQAIGLRRNLMTRYVLPVVMIAGFAVLVGWMSWEIIFPPREVKVVPVFSSVAEIRSEGTPLFNAAGWIEPRPTAVRVAALAPGVVEQLLVVEDQAVQKGEAIAELIKDDARLSLEAAQADLQLREAEHLRARANLQAAQTRFEQPVHLEAKQAEANANLAKIQTTLRNLPYETIRAEARLTYAEREYIRNRKLANKDSIAQRDLDKSLSQFDEANAMVDELKNRKASLEKEAAAMAGNVAAIDTQLELLADEIEARDEAAAQVKAAEARLEQARVAIGEAKLRLDRMTVRAPIGGRVYQLLGQPGTRTGQSSTLMVGRDGSTIVTMYRPEMLQIRVDVRFEDIPLVRLGQTVEIDNPALDEPVAGHVLFVSSEADIQKNTLQVKVAIGAALSLFKPEMLVDVTFLAPKSETKDAAEMTNQQLRLYVPQALVESDSDGTFTWVADQSSGHARKTPISVNSRSNNEMIEVLQGLTVASKIITTTEGLRDGQRIRVVGEDPGYQPQNSEPN